MALAPRNFLTLVPLQRPADITGDPGCVVIHAPRFRSKIGQFFGRLLRRSEQLSLKLDERSAYCWKLIDGERNVQQICDQMQQRFGDEVEPVVQRIMQLLQIFERNRLVSYR
ncbi:MAG: PqqD family protein [Candidatus Alcyoniella australis]|nr:PqqD family protein [Candidatus Alcyoniella australis]